MAAVYSVPPDVTIEPTPAQLRLAAPGWHAKVDLPRATPSQRTLRDESADAARLRPGSGGVSQGHRFGGGGNLAVGAGRGGFARLQLVAQD
jgi:hypothetical protein